ncbi:hypothetical protein CEUSTIGMA_g1762.t1 [Chlamydomonas eustigma]|uniref:Retinoblastoma-associated protein B-box domain-containing protein n=1 Tax=Chlamydomonas eustigma TaxID=1157962 RepID=A0A250WU10_9CHLO|nr:hypothetical protein CEUSTIGMA_g1762.t1 [Chlamydomonas eustigma]|eukprot:GAX74313.1 hypothetical protein CEUSTIGMA_g1762.t1 [Chlamydomonas eustigma]
MSGIIAGKQWVKIVCTDMSGRLHKNAGLFDYFRGRSRSEDLTPTLLNQINQLLNMTFTKDRSSQDALSVQYIYYWILERVLKDFHPPSNHPKARFRTAASFEAFPDAIEKLRCPDFHGGIFVIAHEIVSAVTTFEEEGLRREQCVLATMDRLGQKCSMLAVWDMARYCTRTLSEGGQFGMPPSLLLLMSAVKARAEEELILAEGSLAFEIMFEGGGGMHSPGDMSLLSNFLVSLAHLAAVRAHSTALRLDPFYKEQESSTQAAQLAAKVADHIIAEHIDLCFGLHLSVIVACCVFSVFKVLRRALQFKALLHDMKVAADVESALLMQQLGVRGATDLDQVFAQVPMCGPHGCEDQPETADIRVWYNKVFLPRLEVYVRDCAKNCPPFSHNAGEKPPVVSSGLALDQQSLPASLLDSSTLKQPVRPESDLLKTQIQKTQRPALTIIKQNGSKQGALLNLQREQQISHLHPQNNAKKVATGAFNSERQESGKNTEQPLTAVNAIMFSRDSGQENQDPGQAPMPTLPPLFQAQAALGKISSRGSRGLPPQEQLQYSSPLLHRSGTPNKVDSFVVHGLPPVLSSPFSSSAKRVTLLGLNGLDDDYIKRSTGATTPTFKNYR